MKYKAWRCKSKPDFWNPAQGLAVTPKPECIRPERRMKHFIRIKTWNQILLHLYSVPCKWETGSGEGNSSLSPAVQHAHSKCNCLKEESKISFLMPGQKQQGKHWKSQLWQGWVLNGRGAAVAAGRERGDMGRGRDQDYNFESLWGFPLWIAQSFVKINCDCYTLTFFLLLYSTCSPTCFTTDTQILSCFVWTCQCRGFSWHKGLINNIEPLLTAVFASRVSC